MVHDRFSENYESLKAQAKDTPDNPGVYLWKDGENRIIYAGKAKNLKKRLSSYFSGSKDIKTEALIKRAKYIETIIVSNEYEALLLENTLIKQHNPKYNISLKDGKTYPVVRITADEFPRVFKTRNIVKDGSKYFGPFPNIFALNKVMEMLEKHFSIRKCKTMRKRESPCMYYHIKRCLAPCQKNEDIREIYRVQIERVEKLLSGETTSLIMELSGRMHEAAKLLHFEEAAELRNLIRAIESLSESNSVEDMDPLSRDYIAWVQEGIFTTFSVMSMREGRMTNQELYSSRSAAKEEEALETFLAAYYNPSRHPPPNIYLMKSMAQDGFESLLKQYFHENFDIKTELLIPGNEENDRKHIAVLAMAAQNAKEEMRKRLRERGTGPILEELKNLLNLKTIPRIIEGFDISHMGGKHTAASMISFKNGMPDRKNYSHFKIRSLNGKIDDYASIREVIKRRYSRLIREGQELPDLILVDGGFGQVNAAKSILEELGIDCGLAGLAKREEEICPSGAKTSIKLEKKSEVLKLLQYVRDETHRFAGRLNQKLLSKDMQFPVLESMEGIGSGKARLLMNVFGSLENISRAGSEEIAVKGGISKENAATLIASLRHSLKSRKASFSAMDPAALADEAYAADNESEYGK